MFITPALPLNTVKLAYLQETQVPTALMLQLRCRRVLISALNLVPMVTQQHLPSLIAWAHKAVRQQLIFKALMAIIMQTTHWGAILMLAARQAGMQAGIPILL